MAALSFQPVSVVKNRSRLRRVDAQIGDVLVATSIDGGEAEQQRFYLDYILDTFPIVRRLTPCIPPTARYSGHWKRISVTFPRLCPRKSARGRNDPCPCGSGKKYKHCCMRKGRS